ncbi:MAG: YicC family protein [Clostridiales Family XIII bacterium]|nr:YicC family protein [Clostridiales Family XIII bacterium]
MVKSMTGFGRGEYSDGKRSVTAEIKSVNHRYCEISVRLPKRYGFAEERMKAVVKESLRRGKAELSFLIDGITEADARIRLNMAAAEQYFSNLRALQERFGIGGGIDLGLLAGLPEVMKQMPDIEDEAEICATFEAALRRALLRFDAMRLCEGGKLAEDIRARGALIAARVEEIEDLAPEVVRAYSEKLRERIRELIGDEIELSEERMAHEAAFFADKANITEELVRLKSHLLQLESILSEEGAANGKKLDFLAQEFNREANTIGAKAGDLRITNRVLAMKSEIEKIREQIQNIE